MTLKVGTSPNRTADHFFVPLEGAVGVKRNLNGMNLRNTGVLFTSILSLRFSTRSGTLQTSKFCIRHSNLQFQCRSLSVECE